MPIHTPADKIELIGVTDAYKVDEDGEVYRVYEQSLPADFWSGLQWAREQNAQQRTGDLWRVADVPVVFIEKWLRQGFNALEAPLKDVLKRCRDEHLDDFILTRKRVY